MALNGSAYTQVGAYWRVVLEWSAGQSISNNRSTVTTRLYWQSTSGYGTIRSGGNNTGSITINGTTHNFSGSGLAALSGVQKKLLYTATQTINHNADGSKSIGISGAFAMAVTLQGTYYGSRSVSLTANLDTIPRATTPRIPGNFNLGDTVTITLPRASGNFTHNLSVDFHEGAWVPIASGVGTSYKWTVPKTFANKIIGALQGNGRLRCDTLSGGSTIGGAVVVPFTAHIPGGAEYQPTVSNVAISEAVSGLSDKFGGYVQGKSRLKIQTTAAGAYGSVITNYKTTVLGIRYTGNPVTTGTITSSGTVAVQTVATDSRGRTASRTANITVLPYSPPVISEFSVTRADSAGKEDESEGTYIRAKIKFNVSPVNDKNTKSYTLKYKKQSAYAWTTLTSGSVYSYNGTYVSTSGVLGLDDAYDVALTVADYFTSATSSYKVGSAFTLLDFNADGKSMSVGMVSAGNATLEVAKDLLIKDPTTGAVTYIRPASGDMVWREATMINGWSGHVYYRKNPFGQLEIYGSITPGTVPGVAAILPTGFYPRISTPIPCMYHDTGNVYNGLILHGAGGLQVYWGDMAAGKEYDFSAIMPLKET